MSLITFIVTPQGTDHVERINPGHVTLIIFKWAGNEAEVNRLYSEKKSEFYFFKIV
jgi:hypothetical protein